MAQTFSQVQRTSQTQTQRMSQRQIQSLNLLAMSAEDLRDEIYAAAEKNPALEILDDDFESGVKNFRIKSAVTSDYARVGVASSAGEEKSQAFREILESRPDERETLYGHLMAQLAVANVTPAQSALCQKIIGNLNEKGFFILAPVTLLNPAIGEDFELLQECLSIVQGFEPSGICVANTQESLLLQARQSEGVPVGGARDAAIFLLDGHLDFLNPPVAQKVLKKIQDFVKEQKNLAFNTTDYSKAESFSERDVQNAIDFIKTLDPLPARNFSLGQTQFITPDIYVEKVPSEEGDENSERGGYSFKIRLSDKIVPKIKISSDFAAAQKTSDFAKAAVKEAQVFLESLEFRETTIAKAAAVIVQKQKAFFQNGAGHLLPLRQQDVAQEIGVHESTVSRMATSKYIQCEWGLFPVKYFFTNAIARPSKPNSEESVLVSESLSQESVKVAIEKILAEHAADKKKLSDQKIADILAERGIKVARRTVAKYRAQLNIGSSYNRKN